MEISELPFRLLNCWHFGVVLVTLVLFGIGVLVVLGGQRGAAEVGLVLVVAAGLVVGQLVEAALVEKVD